MMIHDVIVDSVKRGRSFPGRQEVWHRAVVMMLICGYCHGEVGRVMMRRRDLDSHGRVALAIPIVVRRTVNRGGMI
jgi:hypothetical protein